MKPENKNLKEVVPKTGSTQVIKSQQIKYSFLKIMTGSDLSSRRLAVMEARSVNPGPTVWLTGCVHGDEVGGIVVIQEIFLRLRKSPLKLGSLHAFPLMNPAGFETASRGLVLTKEDLNRSFPGNRNGSLAERIAQRIFNAIIETKPALVLDLHNDWLRSIPYALIDPYLGPKHREVYDKCKVFAEKTRLLVVQERESDLAEMSRTLSGSLILRGVPALTLELGEAYVVNEKNVADGVNSVWGLLANLGMVEPNETPMNFEVPKPFRGKRLHYRLEPIASASGIFRFAVSAGEQVKNGQRIGRILNVFGKLTQTLHAPGDGIVLGASDSAVALPGSPIMAFALLPPPRPAEVPAPPPAPAPALPPKIETKKPGK